MAATTLSSTFLRKRSLAAAFLLALDSSWLVDASRNQESQTYLSPSALHFLANSSFRSLELYPLGRGSWITQDPNFPSYRSNLLPGHDVGRRFGTEGKLELSIWSTLRYLGSGTGAAPGSTGDVSMTQELVRRIRLQNKAVLFLMLLCYAGFLLFGIHNSYRQASMASLGATYYADPRFYTQVTESEDLDGFLGAFNVPPKDVQLQITGFAPLLSFEEQFLDAAIDWLGSHYRVAFSFALDLSLWVVPDDRAPGQLPPEDLERLANFLQHDTNDLAAVQIHKKVHWPDWEELATNIKHQIRQSGFTGIVHVCCAEDEVMTIYKNNAWANFMYRRATKVLCALSLIGWLLYTPYMWLRHRALVVTSRYRVNVAISNYWPLIADKVGPEGFSAL